MAEKKKVAEVKISNKPKKKTRINKTALVVALWVTALLLIGYLSFTGSRNNALAANRTAETALTAIKDNNDKKVYELGTDQFKKISTKEQVKTVVNEWSPVLAKATSGKPVLVSKVKSMKGGKELTTLIYKYYVQPGKSKINQKDFYIRVIVEKTDTGQKISAFNFDVKKKDVK